MPNKYLLSLIVLSCAWTFSMGCGGDGNGDSDPLPDTGTGDEAPDTDTGPEIPTDTESDTGPQLGMTCDQPIVLQPGVKYLEWGAHMDTLRTNEWNLNKQDTCWMLGAGCPCMDDCRDSDDGTAAAQACFTDCFNNDPECAGTCQCRRWCEYELLAEKARCDPNDPQFPCTTNCIDNEDVWCGKVFGPEIFFSADIKANQKLIIKDEGNISPFVRILSSCDSLTATCESNDRLPSALSSESRYEWSPAADGTYTIMIEETVTQYSSMGPHYHLEIGVFEGTETDCQDGKDNDGNDLFDCLDPACYASCGIIPTFSDSFDSTLPSGWTAIPPTGAGVWRHTVDDNSTESISGVGHAIVSDYVDAVNIIGDEILETGEVTRLENQKVALTFAHEASYWYWPTRPEIRVSTDGSTWQTIVRYSVGNRENRRNYNRGFEVIDLTPFIGQATSFWLRFVCDDNGVDPSFRTSQVWAIDDVSIIEGDFEILGETTAYVPILEKDDAADGCDGSTPVCENLFGHDFGAGSESLGWYFSGNKCAEAIGDIATKDAYCFFEDPGSCAKTCAAAGECNREGLVDGNWPATGAYTRCYISMCTSSAAFSEIAPLWDGVLNVEIDNDKYCNGDGWETTDQGVQIKTVSPPRPIRTVDEESWVYFCSFSLLPYPVELYCDCGQGSCP